MPISTYARTGIANGVMNNTPFVVPVVCGTLHTADPEPATGTNQGTTLVDTEEGRAQIFSSAAATGTTTSTGETTWTIAEPTLTTLTHIGIHDAFTAGNWLGSEQLDQPVEVVDGDVVSLTAFTFTQV